LITCAPIAKALLNAHKRGVKIEVLLDRSQRKEKYSSPDFLANQGITIKIDSQHAIAHNKVMVIDGETVITGSFNFTKAVEENNIENLLIIRDQELLSDIPGIGRSMRDIRGASLRREGGKSKIFTEY
jgi:phosphatidylserine/phosphatidylglycerophosphate/cardiolipin synthase-like enzyme